MENNKTYDELQDEVSDSTKMWLRTKLGSDVYDSKIQAVIVLTNKVTGKITVDSCNAHLIGDTKKLLNEAIDVIKRQQLITAIAGLVNKGGKENGKHKLD